MQNTVRASLSSGLKSSGGDLSPNPFGGVRPRLNGLGDGLRRLKTFTQFRKKYIFVPNLIILPSISRS